MAEVSLRKWGNSQAIRIPKKILNEAGINNTNADFNISVNKDKEIVLKETKKPQTLDELFDGFNYKQYWKIQNTKSKELDWGKPVGKEIF